MDQEEVLHLVQQEPATTRPTVHHHTVCTSNQRVHLGQRVERLNSQWRDWGMKIIERRGTTVANLLSKSYPWPTNSCLQDHLCHLQGQQHQQLLRGGKWEKWVLQGPGPPKKHQEQGEDQSPCTPPELLPPEGGAQVRDGCPGDI